MRPAIVTLALSMACSSPPPESGSSSPAADPSATAEPKPAEPPEPPAPAKEQAEAPSEPSAPAWSPRPEDAREPHHAVEFSEALDYFFDQLTALDDGEAGVVRVVHIGASMIGQDDLPAVLRGKFQTRFGDGGAGLVLLQRYMNNYRHRWVDLQGTGWDHCYIGYLCKGDGHYGLGGATFWSRGGAKTRISTRKKGLGSSASHIELWYAAQPRGGRIELRVDDGEAVVVETSAESLVDRFHAVDVEAGRHEVSVRPAGGGVVRAYGVVLENERGVVWDQFSWLGAFTKRMHAWNDAHIAAHVKQRDPALLVFTFGGNDTRRLANGKISPERYTAEYVEGIRKVRAGKPEASCMVTAMTDRSRSLDFDVSAVLDDVVEAQRQAAKEAGCAFFDSYAAMGGKGSLAKWRREKPPLAAPDRKHLNHAGRVVLGGWIYDALVAGYVSRRLGPDTAASPQR